MADVDVCVIGGGIQGCGVAQAAAAAGYRTLLLEQKALGHATSSRSSKLIHGGLRYLESGQFSLVAKSLAERERLLRNAPELVKRIPFYIPIYKHTRRRPWQIALGLSLYALLGRMYAGSGFRRVPVRDWPTLDGLEQHGLQAVYQYEDAQTDDHALTRAVMHSAQKLGAELLCPARFTRAHHHQDHFQIDYEFQGQRQSLHSQVLINAAGPWVMPVHAGIQTKINLPPVDLVQGTHLVLHQPAPSGVYYVEAPSDHRAVFIMPWQGFTLVGTTETIVTGDPAKVQPRQEEILYLQHIARMYFPQCNSQIVDQFAGVRVLVRTQQGVFRRPRDTQLFTHDMLPGYVALIGGKLTAYRVTAERVIALLKPHLPVRAPCADTRSLKLVPATD